MTFRLRCSFVLMPRLSFFNRKDLSEAENKRWMTYWAVYGVVMFAVLFALNKNGIDLSIWEKFGIAAALLAIIGAIYYLTGKRKS